MGSAPTRRSLLRLEQRRKARIGKQKTERARAEEHRRHKASPILCPLCHTQQLGCFMCNHPATRGEYALVDIVRLPMQCVKCGEPAVLCPSCDATAWLAERE